MAIRSSRFEDQEYVLSLEETNRKLSLQLASKKRYANHAWGIVRSMIFNTVWLKTRGRTYGTTGQLYKAFSTILRFAFGVKRLEDIPEEKHDEFVAMAKSLLLVINPPAETTKGG